MRLSDKEKEIIVETIRLRDPKAIIYLFGSRVNDSLKGGDIDLLIFSDKLTFVDKIEIKTKIFEYIEEQKIDLVLAKDKKKPFIKLALEKGVLLE